MERISAIFASLAVMLFIISSLMFAVSPQTAPMALPMTAASTQLAAMTSLVMPGLTDAPAVGTLDLHSLFLRPDNAILWILLIAVWVALAAHALGVLQRQRLTDRAGAAAERARPVASGLAADEPGPPTAHEIAAQHRVDNAPSEHAPLTLALIIGAIWPWIIRDHPALGFVMAMAMLSLALTSAIRGQRDGNLIRRVQSVGMFTGWATAVTYAAFATLLNNHLGISAVAATVAAMLLCAVAGVTIQLRLSGIFSYSVAIIWSLVGLALATMSSDATIAMVAIIGISAMAIVLVRAAS